MIYHHDNYLINNDIGFTKNFDMLLWICLFVLTLSVQDVSSHVLNYDSVTVCDGILKQIQCPPSENIHVLQGFYGKWKNHGCKGDIIDSDNLPTCKADRSMVNDKVKELCQGKNQCTLVSDKSIYGEPCPDNKAYLYMTFFCMRNGQKLVHRKTQNEMEVVTVPSHGFIIREEKVHLEEQRRQKEQEEAKRAKLLKLSAPSLLNPNKKPEYLKTKEIDEARTRQELQKKAQRQQQQNQYNQQQVQRKLSLLEKDLNNKQISNPSSSPVSNERPKPVQDVAPIFNSIQEAKAIESALEDKDNLLKKQDNIQSRRKPVKNNTVKTAANEEKVLAKQKSMIYDFLLRSQIPKVKTKVSQNVDATKSLVAAGKTDSNNKPTPEKEENDMKHSDVSDLKLEKIAEQLEREGPRPKIPAINETSADVRSSIICNGESKLIACLPEEEIKILDAFYGKRIGEDCHGKLPYQDDAPTCSALDAHTNVKESCNKKQSCLLFADENVYGKSLCPNVNKYLQLQYTCSPIPVEENDVKKDEVAGSNQVKGNISSSSNQTTSNVTASDAKPPDEKIETDDETVSSTLKQLSMPVERKNSTELLCNGQTKTIKCENEPGLSIVSAFYGKKGGKDCRGELGYRDDIPECDNPRVFESLKKSCDNQKSCDVTADKDLYGKDECPGVNKYLEVAYAC